MAACVVGAGSVVGLAAAPAAAATWTVSGGTAASGHGRTDFKNTTAGVTLATCRDSSFTSSFTNGVGLPGAGIGQMLTWSFHETGLPAGLCTAGPTGFTVSVVAIGLPYVFNAVGYNAISQTTTGTLTGLRFSLNSPADNCVVTVGGPGGTTGTLNWSLQGNQLTFSGGNLTAYSVSSSCDPTAINGGDSISANGTYTVSPSTLKITSP
ncbi:hypothetical protein [Actinomadura harenae]|uniref:Uncharacterized protein n=1 Tax=Actinomadura harenae TaxID=2483351 RepID=A0A3M2LHK3_9ACTN|nr:hypothetical protein [Actinomadura harenae]RMI36959.1 hypothetical protein EBO15_37175 [Actinomadura harenae]